MIAPCCGRSLRFDAWKAGGRRCSQCGGSRRQFMRAGIAKQKLRPLLLLLLYPAAASVQRSAAFSVHSVQRSAAFSVQTAQRSASVQEPAFSSVQRSAAFSVQPAFSVQRSAAFSVQLYPAFSSVQESSVQLYPAFTVSSVRLYPANLARGHLQQDPRRIFQ